MQIMVTWGFGIGTQHAWYMVWIGSLHTVLDELVSGGCREQRFSNMLLIFFCIFLGNQHVCYVGLN